MAQNIPDNVWICRTSDEVDKIVSDNRLAVVKLGARWCGPCKTSSPAYHALAAEYDGFKNISFMSVDIDDNPMYNEKIAAVPAFVFYVDGIEKEELMQLGADMKPVREVILSIVEQINGEQSVEQPPRTLLTENERPGRTMLTESQTGLPNGTS